MRDTFCDGFSQTQGSDGQCLRMNYLCEIAARGGPAPEEFEELEAWFRDWEGSSEDEYKSRFRNIISNELLSKAFSPSTCQGFVMHRPRGYSGDFEIIKRIYQERYAEELDLRKWDAFFHHQKAVWAVRNRRRFMSKILRSSPNLKRALTVGGGPCVEIKDYLEGEVTSKEAHFVVLDSDVEAIRHAKESIGNSNWVTYHIGNALRFRSDEKFNLIYSLGLFDYLSDRAFAILLRRLAGQLEQSGKIIIGNFSESNPSRGYMEFGGWFLNHRTKDKMNELAERAGLSNFETYSDPYGVNLYLEGRLR